MRSRAAPPSQPTARLSALAFRAKAHWGYDTAFMERVRPALTLCADDLAQRRVVVALLDERIVAFYAFTTYDGATFLDDLWVDPPQIGHGLGTQAWQHAVATASSAGEASFLIESDPFAEGFYLRMGALRIGERISPQTGRSLPLLRYRLSAQS